MIIKHNDELSCNHKALVANKKLTINEYLLNIEVICNNFIKQIMIYNHQYFTEEKIIPVMILRGGLIFYNPLREFYNTSPLGLLFHQYTDQDQQEYKVYGDLPYSDSHPVYLLCDVIINTGHTMVDCIQHIGDGISRDNFSIQIASPYSTKNGLNRLIENYPDLIVHTLWDDEQLDDNMRLESIPFDMGDFVFGGATGNRLKIT